jgi:hypothetical protein
MNRAGSNPSRLQSAAFKLEAGFPRRQGDPSANFPPTPNDHGDLALSQAIDGTDPCRFSVSVTSLQQRL